MQEAINLFTEIVKAAIPYGVVFSVGQMIVNMFLKMAFKGVVEL